MMHPPDRVMVVEKVQLCSTLGSLTRNRQTSADVSLGWGRYGERCAPQPLPHLDQTINKNSTEVDLEEVG